MQFEFDPRKSASNKDKHGLDFKQAQAIWDDGQMREAGAVDKSEPRRMAIGRIAGKLWTAIFTVREGKVRLISVRRSRDKEILRYEEPDNGRDDLR